MRLISCLFLLVALACTAHADDKFAAKAAWAWACSVQSSQQPCDDCKCGCANGQNCTCDVATISVAAPPDAVIYVDGNPTKTVGKEVRTFASPKLKAGHEYQYEIRVGNETKVVSFKPGQSVKVSFLPAPMQQATYQPMTLYQSGCVGGSCSGGS